MAPEELFRLAALLGFDRSCVGKLFPEYVVMGVNVTFTSREFKTSQGAIFGRYESVKEAEEALSGFKKRYLGSRLGIYTLAENGKEWVGLDGTRVPRG